MAKGSIEQRGENSWRLTVDLGTLPNGKRNRPRKSITVDDKKILRSTRRLNEYLDDQLALFKQEVLSGEYIKPDKMIFSQYINLWKKKYAELHLAASTRDAYYNHIRNHIEPRFGNKKMTDIKTLHIVDFIADLKKLDARKDGKGKLSDRTVQYIYAVMQNLFTIAVKWELIKNNPLEKTDRPKAKKVKAKFYESEEVTKIINALYKEPVHWRLMMLTAIIGGLRRAELVALRWSHVDFNRKQIFVEKSIPLKRKGVNYEKGTKNDDERYVDMPNWLMDEFEDFRKEWLIQREATGDKWKAEESEYVFHAGYGTPFYYTHPTAWWKMFTKRHKFSYYSLHKLRHTSVTVLIEKGASIKSIQERVGHKQTQTTTDIYAHVTKKLSREVANLFDELDPAKENSVPNPSPIKI
ncbi:integrase [Paenibacillus alvei TS-15]|uniref:Integrase n=1 Tax=Paenibacillus alvei TS-15 TaxID=1117108 RepID=S9TWT3_PAEAL|nr:tyrosine-type recombinase/integrase [Paenibacillus alvei]EPY06661.1 integrase [Paenibacillus alvei TS-15]